jgi:DNA-directed RNA polymerase subunit RPC12/RpoP
MKGSRVKCDCKQLSVVSELDESDFDFMQIGKTVLRSYNKRVYQCPKCGMKITVVYKQNGKKKEAYAIFKDYLNEKRV